jgi:hypothetical protein
MEFWEKYNIKEEYLNQILDLNTRSYSIKFDIPNTIKEEWEFYYNKGFDFVFTNII